MKPNIILINCDDLGYGDVGCYGSELNRTPNLDKMAEEGIKFEDFYSGAPVCSPSRGALMTGCYPPRVGFGKFGDNWVLFPGDPIGLNPAETTIAGCLKSAGYATKIIGKWHCGDQTEFLPTRHGFDSYYGIPYSNDMGRQVANLFYPPLPLLKDEEVIQQQPDQCALTERYVENAVEFIKDNTKNKKPFFLYLAHMHVHLPLYVSRRFELESKNGSYGAAVECVDWSVGVIMAELKKLGIDDNTILIFTSDNGSHGGDVCNAGVASNAPFRAGKGSTYEGGMRMPFIVRWPDKIKKGAVNTDITTAMDILPTLANIANAPLPALKIDGMDMSPLWFDDGEWKRDTFFYYFMTNLEAVRHSNWKLHIRKHGDEVKELYDLSKDCGEQNNLYEQNPDIVKKLTSLIENMRIELGDAVSGIEGKEIRPIGRVENPTSLTTYDENHPYMFALYDLEQWG